MNDFNVYSPVQRLPYPAFKEKSIHVDVKRDDMIHPYISGNKWRKLKYTLQKAQQENRRHLVTFGGAWSNHILATACLCARMGFTSTAYIRGEEVENPVLQLSRLFGMSLFFVDRENYKDKPGIFERFHGLDPDAYFIDEGGFSAEAARGCEEIMLGLPEQYDHIFCACGTGATLAGIAKGAELHQPHARIHGIPVLKGGGFIQEAVTELYPELRNVTLHLDYHFGGYAKTKPELLDFIKSFCSTTGLLIEPIYTGKTFFALQDLALRDYFKAGEKVLIIHTGGLTGFLGKAHLFV